MKSTADYVVLSFLIPDKEMKNEFIIDSSPSVQTQTFNWNFIKALESSNAYEFSYISSRAISDYPINPQKYIKRNNWNVNFEGKNIKIEELPFINIGIIKLLSRFVTSFLSTFKVLVNNNNKKGIIVYSVHVPFLITGVLISKIFRIQLISVWTDPPSVLYSHDSLLKKYLRKIELKISKFLMSKSDKLIVLTKYLAEDFAPRKPYIVVEGILDEIDYFYDSISNNNSKITVVYTGTLEGKYGIQNIVKAINLLSANNVELHIYGKGNFSNDMIKLLNENVIYKGYLNREEILKVQKKADFLINARSNDDDYVKYSFPSKTLEYLSSGTLVISTMLKGIPKEYEDYMIIAENNSPEKIKEAIEKAISLSSEEKKKILMKSLEFIEGKKFRKQGERIYQFIRS